MKGFSVIMPTYNQAAFIKRAILSLYQQNYPNWELIIVNDGCNDETEKYIAEYLSDKRIIYVKNDANQGLGFAVNQGLEYAIYDYIAYLPSDDYYYDNHLQLLMEEFDESEDIALVVSGIKFHNSDSCFPSNNNFSQQLVKDYPLQLVQTAHKKTDDRWVERAQLVTDDLFSLFWYKLMDKGIIVFTNQVTAHWTKHPCQRHKIIMENLGGGLNCYRSYYQVHIPIKLQSRGAIPVDEEKIYVPFQNKIEYLSRSRLKILIVGELSYNPERILALEERGHILYGLWIEKPAAGFNTVGPLPFGNVTDISYKNWKEEIKKIDPDVIYALLNVKAIPLAHEVLMNNLDIPFVWHFKEGPSLSMQYGLWNNLIDLYSYSDGQIYINSETKDWYAQFIHLEKQMPFILGGDLPKIDYFTNDFSSLLSDVDGEIHTVTPGRVIGIFFEDLKELAKHKIHLHSYVQYYLNQREDFILMAKEAMGSRFHLHPPCIPQDWVKELSQYDAGWLHCFRSTNENQIIKAGWDDLNLPSRMNTLAAACLPMLQFNNQGHIVAAQSKVKALDMGVFFDSYEHLGALLKNKEQMQMIRKNVLKHRELFSFDYHVPSLIDFFRKVIDKKKKKR